MATILDGWTRHTYNISALYWTERFRACTANNFASIREVSFTRNGMYVMWLWRKLLADPQRASCLLQECQRTVILLW